MKRGTGTWTHTEGRIGEKPPSASQDGRPQTEPGRRHRDLGPAASSLGERNLLLQPSEQTKAESVPFPQPPLTCGLSFSLAIAHPEVPLWPSVQPNPTSLVAQGGSHKPNPKAKKANLWSCLQSKPSFRTTIARTETAQPRASCSSLAAVAKATLPPRGRDPQPGLGVQQDSHPSEPVPRT